MYGATHVGRVRKNNEDTFVVHQIDRSGLPAPAEVSELSTDGPGVLLMVCDGMGGAAAGEVASALAVETVCRTLSESRARPDLISALVVANEAIYETSRRRSDARGMGTTATAALVRDDRLLVAQVGDSRGYLFRNNDLERLTRDQSLAAEMLEAGILSPEKVRDFRRGNVILQALGVAETVTPVVTKLELRPEDIILLCSDGLHGQVDDDQVLSILRGPGHLRERAIALLDATLDAGAPDNVTVVLGRFNG